MYTGAPLALGGGLLESVGQAAAIAGTGLLVLMLVALGAYGYKQLRGGGVDWPDEDEETDGVTRGDDDDEWDYY
ncbi:MAG: hypothetical protein ABEH64_02010 [Salinirussus sp.]